MVEATISAIYAYRVKYHKMDNMCCWKASGCNVVWMFSGVFIGRYINSYLHQED